MIRYFKIFLDHMQNWKLAWRAHLHALPQIQNAPGQKGKE